MEVIEDIIKVLKISQKQQMSHFHRLCQLQLPICQNRPVQLVPVLLECITNTHKWRNVRYTVKIIAKKLTELQQSKSLGNM